MKRNGQILLIAMVLSVILPLAAVRIAGNAGDGLTPTQTLQTEQTTLQTQTPLQTTVPLPPQTQIPETTVPPTQPPVKMWISVLTGDEVQLWELETYLMGVLLAEMPAGFEMEALKAQAVAARTIALRCCEKKSKHDGAVCLKSSCCQGYLSEEDYYARGGKTDSVEKIRSAIHQTRGEVLTYQGELIQAAYFSCSGGSTEDAADVWGGDLPYLQAVPSPGEEKANAYCKTVTFTLDTFVKKLGRLPGGLPETWFGKVTHTDGGGVETMVIGGVTYTGAKLRKLFGLNSTKFTVSVTDGNIQIVTYGFGHRVGMSQYGADAMAVLGSTYPQILAHYFQGTELTKWVS